MESASWIFILVSTVLKWDLYLRSILFIIIHCVYKIWDSGLLFINSSIIIYYLMADNVSKCIMFKNNFVFFILD